MILVTLGTQDKDFSRLLKAIEKQIKNKVIKEKVVVQAGHTKFKSKHMEIFDYIPMDEFEKLMKECSILITHGGVGSIISGISKDKPVIAAARLEKYKEHTNDHQEQIIEEFAKEGYILELKDFDKLDEVYKKSKTFKAKKYKSNTKNMVKLLDEYIDENSNKEFHKYLPFMLYALISLLSEFINMNLINLINILNLHKNAFYSVAWFISTLISFLLIKDIVFKNKGWKVEIILKELPRFFTVRIIMYVVNVFGLVLLIKSTNLKLIVIQVILFTITLFVNFNISKYKTFKEN